MLEEEVVGQTCGVFEGDGERQKTAENYQNISSLRMRLEKRERNQMTWKLRNENISEQPPWSLPIFVSAPSRRLCSASSVYSQAYTVAPTVGQIPTGREFRSLSQPGVDPAAIRIRSSSVSSPRPEGE